MERSSRGLAVASLALLLAACGGGGGGSAPPPVPPPAPPTAAELNSASRLASQATFGLNYAAIEALAQQGNAAWLNQQFALAPSLNVPVVDDLIGRLNRGELPAVPDDLQWLIQFRRFAWWHTIMTAPDQLRQRVAFALSQIMVASDNVDALIVYPGALSTYNDVLLTHAFGNYRDLLREVALSPAMGIYLSHINNRKADPANNIFPDENFAREVMQLFSIGLFELNIDGTPQLDGNGVPLPTYDNDDIREFAKIFTGFSFRGPGAVFGGAPPNFREPMQMFDAFHEPGEKRLLNGLVVPAGQTGIQDFDAAIDNLFNHPNVGPFIGTRLIQRLVTSNPSPAYVERVARAFNGDTTGVRGDMGAVVRAILTDPEAANPNSDAGFGKLREPVLRAASLYRQFNATSSDGFFANSGFLVQQLTRQHPFSSPSVFNFFLPDHTPPGALATAGLVAPEFQITTASTIVGMTNLIDFAVNGGFIMTSDPALGTVTFNLSDYVNLAQDVDALLDRLDLVVTYGTLSTETRAAMRGVLVNIADADARARTAIYLILISPDYAIGV